MFFKDTIRRKSMQSVKEIRWCKKCNVPIMDHKVCPICNEKTKYLTTDIRPVFPEERLIIEILLNKPFEYLESSVWASKMRFYIDGKPLHIPQEVYKTTDALKVKEMYSSFCEDNTYQYFHAYIKSFLQANRQRLELIKNEAIDFIAQTVEKYNFDNKFISFSGGKDSTVIADLVLKSLYPKQIPHIFCDTTLEFPFTYDYISRYKNREGIRFLTAKNTERNFYDMCEIIGPPSRNMRWCCTMFKTGPIARLTSAEFQGNVLSFLGIRSSESAMRSKYNRINVSDSTVKIQGHVTASPIFYWKDCDVWLYLFGEDIDFNQAYRFGYNRVGCYCCPNNTERNQFLTKIFLPDLSQKWYNLLVDFAKKTNKLTPYEYVEGGYWKARQGGQGLEAANHIKIDSKACVTEENAKVYQLNKPISNEFWELFTPLGIVSKEAGRKLLDEVIVLDKNTHYPIVSIVPYTGNGYDNAVKIKVYPNNPVKKIERRCGYQIRKYNACQSCLKCESICSFHAISLENGAYHIDEKKCKRCGKCITNKYLSNGCLMYRYLFDSEKLK